jgi:hypothetical protein
MIHTTTLETVEKIIPEESRRKRTKYFNKKRPGFRLVLLKYQDTGDTIHRYLLHEDTKVGYFLVAFRKRHRLKPSVGIITLVETRRQDKIKSYQISTVEKVGELYNKYHHSDGILYLNVTLENVFG